MRSIWKIKHKKSGKFISAYGAAPNWRQDWKNSLFWGGQVTEEQLLREFTARGKEWKVKSYAVACFEDIPDDLKPLFELVQFNYEEVK